MKTNLYYIMLGLSLVIFPACNGLFDSLYDEASDVDSSFTVQGDTIEGSFYLEATDWAEWFYLDLHALHDAVLAAHTHGVAFDSTQLSFTPYAVPFGLTGDWDGVSYNRTYRFRVLTGGGLSDYELQDSTQVDTQTTPGDWDLGFHRNNVRTHGGSALQTSYTSFDDLPANSSSLLQAMMASGVDTTFTADVYNERDVWVDNTNMIAELIPCQGIEINEVLSSWLRIDIPPIPPSFTHQGNVYLLRMSDGTIAALRLSNYMSTSGTKCCLTIQVKYPY